MDQLTLSASQISQGSFLLIAGLAFLGGIATAFTPCVYPMIPITLGIMGGQKSKSMGRAFRLSLAFVLGLAIIYTALGFTAAASGRVLGSLTQQPWMIWTISLLFLVMGLGLLGLFEIRLPYSLTQWLAKRGGPGYGGSAVLGMVSGVLAAPCAGPVVVGILAYVAQKSNPFLGFALLFAYSLGIGAPFVLLGTFSQLLRNLPRSGLWTEWMKHLCGLALVVAFFFFIHPLVSPPLFTFLIAGGLLFMAIFIRKIFPLGQGPRTSIYWGGRIVLVMVAAFLFFYVTPSPPSNAEPSSPSSVKWMTDETKALAEASQQKKPLIIDFSAEWCTACQELDQHTFTEEKVQAHINKGFVPVRIDATAIDDDAVREILMKYSVLALPTVLFLDPSGKVEKDLTVNAFVPAKELLKLMEKASTRAEKCTAAKTC